LRGKSLSYSVTLKGLKERDLLPLDDDFAKTVGDADTLAELRDELREDLHQRRTAAARSEALARIIEKMEDGATIDLPEPMIDNAVEEEVRRMRGSLSQQGASLEAYLRATDQSEADLRAEMRPGVTQRLRNSLLLRTIAEREGIAVADEEIDAAIQRMVNMAPDAAREADQVKRIEAFARSGYVRDMLQSEFFERQLTDRLIEIATDGRGAVVNGWEPPANDEADAEAADDATVTEETQDEAVSAAATEASEEDPPESA
jgi:trigger factor